MFIVLLSGLLFACIHGSAAAQEQNNGKSIDPTQFQLTWSDEFDRLDVSAWGPGTRWIAHTPWGGDFGDSRFANPAKDFPFVVQDGILRIEARKSKDGRWFSGLLASYNKDWEGFAQQFGYFEMRAKLPEGPGLWPAFWLIGIDRTTHTSEIDILEHYGHKPHQFSSGVAVWDRKDKRKHQIVGAQTPVPVGSLYRDYNTFGAAIDAKFIRVYLNRKEVWRTPTPPRHHQPMFVLLNLAMGPGWPIDKTPNPSFMYVDYVRVWKLPDQFD